MALFILIGVGIYNIVTGNVSPELHAPIGTPVAGITLFLLLKAFASGSSALTGVEAISNAIPNFQHPAPRNAAKTFRCNGTYTSYFIYWDRFFSVLLRISPKARGNGCLSNCLRNFWKKLYVLFCSRTTALILVLAANTGYSAFPFLLIAFG